MINGYDTIFVEKSGKLDQINECFESPEQLRDIITGLVQDIGRPFTKVTLISYLMVIRLGLFHGWMEELYILYQV